MSDDKHERAARRLLVEAIQDGVDPVERIAAVLRERDRFEGAAKANSAYGVEVTFRMNDLVAALRKALDTPGGLSHEQVVEAAVEKLAALKPVLHPMRRLSTSELEQAPPVDAAEVDRALRAGQADRDAAVAGTPGSTEHDLVHDIGRDRIVCKRCGQLGLECAGTSCPVYDEKDEGLRLAEDALADAIVERVETLDDLHMNGVNLSETVRQLGEALECREMDRVVRLVRGLFGSIGGRDQQPLSWPPDTDPVR